MNAQAISNTYSSLEKLQLRYIGRRYYTPTSKSILPWITYLLRLDFLYNVLYINDHVAYGLSKLPLTRKRVR